MSVECDELAQLTDLNERIEHEMLGCSACIELRVRSLLQPPTKIEPKVATKQEASNVISEKSGYVRKAHERAKNASLIKALSTIKVEVSKTDSQEKAEGNFYTSQPNNQTLQNQYGKNARPANCKDQFKKKHDKLAVRNIANLTGLTKSEAALKLVEERRFRPKIDHKDPKINVPASEMPWVPEPDSWMSFPPKSQSVLKPADHRRYVAIISNLLTKKPNFRFDLNKLELQGMDGRLQPERDKFQEYAIKHIKHFQVSPYFIRLKASEDLFIKREKDKIIERIGNLQFHDVVSEIPWSVHSPTDELTSGSFHLKTTNVFVEGKPCRIRIPDVRRKCQFNMNSEVIEENLRRESKEKVSIQNDENLQNLALINNLEYVIDACTLRHFLSGQWLFRNQQFVNRVSVVRRVKDGITHRICYISKPFLGSKIDLLYVHRQFLKWCVKTELRQTFEKQRDYIHRAKTFKKSEIKQKQSNCETTKHPTVNVVSNDTEVKSMKVEIIPNEDYESESNLIMDEKFDDGLETECVAFEKPIVAKELQLPATGGNDDLLGNILNSMGLSAQSSSSANLMKTKLANGTDMNVLLDSISLNQNLSVCEGTNKCYRYIKVSLDAEAKHSILLRSAGHGVDQEGKTISLSIKNEYVPEVGSQKMHDEEMLWNWLTATLKGSIEHLVFYMNPRNGHCIQIKRSDPPRTFSDFPHQIKQLFWWRVQRFCSLIDELDSLDAGEYLIVPDNSSNEFSLKILSEQRIIDEKSEHKLDGKVKNDFFSSKISDIGENNIKEAEYSDVYNRSLLINACQFNQDPPYFENNVFKLWNSVDEHLPLMWHIIHGRIPGSFFPRLQEQGNQKTQHGIDAAHSESQKTSNSFHSRSRRKRRKRLRQEQSNHSNIKEKKEDGFSSQKRHCGLAEPSVVIAKTLDERKKLTYDNLF